MNAVLQRRELDYLQTWYREDQRKPLVIRGASQVGKSTLVRQFAEQNGLNLLELNFERNPEYRDAFGVNDPRQILTTLSLLTGEEFDVDKGLLFLDEIQAAPEAIIALRYFYEEQPDVAVLAAGSLLEFTLQAANFSMPVGRIEYMHMGPICFSDFLVALGETALAKHLATLSLQDITQSVLPDAVHQKCMALFRQYCVVGGMPEAVANFVTNRSYASVLKAQSSVLATYRDDFNKYSHGVATRLVQLVFDSAPLLVGRKFKFSHVSRDYRADQLRAALDQLCMARVLAKVNHTSANGIPLGAEQKENSFKILFMDIGLLCSMLNINEIDLKGDGPSLANKGSVAEQFIGQHLLYVGQYYREPAVFYWAREAKSAAAEVDYLITSDQQIVPVEIKAGSTGTLRSLHQFLFEKQGQYALRFNAGKPSLLINALAKTSKGEVVYHLLSLPLYLVEQSKRLTADLRKMEK